MNTSSAVFASLSVKPHTIKELINKLPYSSFTIYEAVKDLEKKGLVRKICRGKNVLLIISDGYKPQRLREIYIRALSFGIDPAMLLRDNTIAVWKSIEKPKTLREIQEKVKLSDKWVKRILKFLADSNLAVYKKRKPIIAVLREEHELNRLLKTFTKKEEKTERIYYVGTTPFEKLIKTPENIERILYEKIDESLTIKDTGFLIRGKKGSLSILESAEKEISIEELFLREINTPEGVEDFCIRLIASKKIDYKHLLTLAKKKDMVNVVGCYIDVLNSIKKIVEPDVINAFERNISKHKRAFLSQEKRYGKAEWEDKYEKKWNVDIYLDIGAIRHGVRSV